MHTRQNISDSVSFAREILTANLCEELLPLLKLHWGEVSGFPDIAFQPDAEWYLNSEAIGLLRAYIARHEGQIVGYALYIVSRNPHNRESKQAFLDGIFIPKELRGFGHKLIQFGNEALRAEGVQVVFHTMKIEHDHSPTLLRMGYVPQEIHYSRRLDA